MLMRMKKQHIITISGKPGSGKSSTADRVAELLGYTRHSSGDVVRKYIAQHNITLRAYNDQAHENHELDAKVDEVLRDLRDKKDIVIDSRLGFYWIPESFKVYLDLDLDTATARIYKDMTLHRTREIDDIDTSSLSAVAKQVRQRMQVEQQRFRSLYGVDPFNTGHFDLIINTSRNDPQSVAITVFDHYKKWLDSETWTQVKTGVPLGYSYKNQY
jgi:cytidylate kinase